MSIAQVSPKVLTTDRDTSARSVQSRPRATFSPYRLSKLGQQAIYHKAHFTPGVLLCVATFLLLHGHKNLHEENAAYQQANHVTAACLGRLSHHLGLEIPTTVASASATTEDQANDRDDEGTHQRQRSQHDQRNLVVHHLKKKHTTMISTGSKLDFYSESP